MLLIANVTITIVQTRPTPPITFGSLGLLVSRFKFFDNYPTIIDYFWWGWAGLYDIYCCKTKLASINPPLQRVGLVCRVSVWDSRIGSMMTANSLRRASAHFPRFNPVDRKHLRTSPRIRPGAIDSRRERRIALFDQYHHSIDF